MKMLPKLINTCVYMHKMYSF